MIKRVLPLILLAVLGCNFIGTDTPIPTCPNGNAFHLGKINVSDFGLIYPNALTTTTIIEAPGNTTYIESRGDSVTLARRNQIPAAEIARIESLANEVLALGGDVFGPIPCSFPDTIHYGPNNDSMFVLCLPEQCLGWAGRQIVFASCNGVVDTVNIPGSPNCPVFKEPLETFYQVIDSLRQ